MMQYGERNRARSRAEVGDAQIFRPRRVPRTQEIHGTLHEDLGVGTRDERVARDAKRQPHELPSAEDICHRRVRAALLDIAAKRA